jgi:hypothetical protein
VEDSTDPIDDEELLYRRVPASTGWYSPEAGLSPQAFAPHKTLDATGLSVYRGKYKSVEDVARGRPGRSYYVAVLRAGDLRAKGIEVVPRPAPGDPGHAELCQLHSRNRKTAETLERQRILAAVCLRVEGPFETNESGQG